LKGSSTARQDAPEMFSPAVVVEVHSIFKQVVFCDYPAEVAFAETTKWTVDAFRDGAL